MRKSVKDGKTELWKNNSWILHDDNAPSHRTTIVSEFIAKDAINTIDHPPYSPDLAPCNFFCFPNLNCHSVF
uniref:Putative LOC101236796 [Hydra vulgaris] n=1 Tax=Lepeophtheirus salmonis TaxID=72036 RepID=A0A0K2URM5_LEPSM